ncbi:MAG TPA: hypothetical protein VK787_04160, partial [Puia sp.]|nr:hypothetical protein [Puia sp.]
RCVRFITNTIQKPENTFLAIIAGFKTRKRIIQLFFLQLLIYLPVFLYALIIVVVAFYNKRFAAGSFVFIFNFGICIISAFWYSHVLSNQGKNFTGFLDKIFNINIGKRNYGLMLVRYIFYRQKIILFSLKCYTCGILYLIIHNLSKEDYDTRLAFILYSFGLFGHGILIWLTRNFEEKNFISLRTLPLSRSYRFTQYSLLYFILLIPEFVTIISLVPKYLHVDDAVNISICSFCILLLSNSLTFITRLSIKDFLKISFAIFFVMIFSVFTNTQIWIALLFFISAALIFVSQFFKYEIS